MMTALILVAIDSGPVVLTMSVKSAVEALPESEPRVLQIRALVLGTAMDWIAEHEASTNHILGFPFTNHGLRLGVEAALRNLARVATSQAHRYALVDMANNVRPTSTF